MKYVRWLSLIGVGIFVYVIWQTGISNILQSFNSINYMIIFSFLFLPVIYLLQAWKWHKILEIQGIDVNFWQLMKVHLIGVFYGTLTPGRAGSLLKAIYLKKIVDKPAMELTSSVMLERLLDFLCVCSLAIVGAFLFVQDSRNILLPIIIVLIVFIFGMSIIMSKRNFIRLMNIFSFLIPNKLKSRLDEYVDSFYRRMIKKSQLLYPGILTLVTWCAVYFGSYIIALSLGVQLNWFVFISLFSLATIISLIPITISGIGTRELTLITLLAPFGVPKEITFTISILSVVIYLLIPSFIGWFLSLVHHK